MIHPIGFGRAGLLAAAAFVGLALAPAVQAHEYHLHFHLSGKSETPPNDSTGKGEGDATYDDKTMELRWKISWSGLSGDPKAAHFHGPAKPGESAKPTVVMQAPDGLSSPLIGSATLTDDQAKDLLAGRWYWNIHTPNFPGGELRGQVIKGGGGVKAAPKAKPAADKPAQ